MGTRGDEGNQSSPPHPISHMMKPPQQGPFCSEEKGLSCLAVAGVEVVYLLEWLNPWRAEWKLLCTRPCFHLLRAVAVFSIPMAPCVLYLERMWHVGFVWPFDQECKCGKTETSWPTFERDFKFDLFILSTAGSVSSTCSTLLRVLQLDLLVVDAAKEKRDMEQKHSTIQQKVHLKRKAEKAHSQSTNLWCTMWMWTTN